MIVKYVLLVIALSATICVCNESDPRARLLVSKQILNKYLVENMDIVVKYSLFNTGNAPAHKVELEDRGFPSDSFDIAGGSFNMKMDKIRPQENVTHVVVVRPNKYGYFNFTAALVRYFPNEESQEVNIYQYFH